MDYKQSMAIVAKLHNAYVQDRFAKPEELSKRIDLYTIYFADMPYRIVDAEVDIWIKSFREMPTVSELLSKCKDALSIESSPKFADDIKPTWWYILEARGVDMDAPIPPEVTAMSDKLIKAMRRDPRLRARYEAEKKNKPTADGTLPYEV